MTEQRSRGPVVVFLLVQLLADVLLAVLISVFLAPGGNNWQQKLVVSLWLGVTFSQVSLLSLWSALGRGRLPVRLAVTLAAGAGIWLVAFAFALQSSTSGPRAAVPGVAMFVQWVVIQVPLWGARLFCGWRLGDVQQPSVSSAAHEVQFGIKHLVGWITLVAVSLGIGKRIITRESLSDHELQGFALFLVFNCLFTWPTLLSALAQRRPALCGLAAFGIMLMITIAEPRVFGAALGNAGETELFFLLNSVQFAWVFGCMWYLQRLGTRLVRG